MKPLVRRLSFALACAAATPASLAQTAAPPAPAASGAATLAPVVVTGRTPLPATVSGWNTPLAETPIAATSVGSAEIRDAGARRLADLIRFDPAASDAYNSVGYIDYLTVRGFVLDNRFNYRRDGLPINAETSIPLENKSRVDIWKGTSGIEAGTSAPGGLVNYVVKRPLAQPLSEAVLQWKAPGNVMAAVDLGRRFGGAGGDAFGLRLNLAAERLNDFGDGTRGRRRVLALAGDWRAGAATLIEAEIETSHRAQPSQAAFSLLGDRVPNVPKPHVSLNDQPWTEPVVFDGTTVSLRATQKLAPDWQLVVHAAQQRLKTDDREAFPFGCSAEGRFDRFCSDGTFDLYDFRSANERRRQSALDLRLDGRVSTGPLAHDLTLGGLRSWVRNRLHDYAYNPVGSGTIDGDTVRDPDPMPNFANTDRSERSTELHARDRIRWGAWSAWLGARRTRLERSSLDTRGQNPTRISKTLTSPFAALSVAPAAGQLLYGSWSRGVESDVAPVLPMYANRGQPLPPARSRQIEAGWKGATDTWDWDLALFDIRRPFFDDVGLCDGSDASCTRELRGTQRHRGLDAALGWRRGEWSARLAGQWLHARIRSPAADDGEGSAAAVAYDGKRPTNVPATSLRAGLAWSPSALPGLALQAAARYEGPREVLRDNSVRLGGWTTADLGARFARRIADVDWTLRFGVDNVTDRRAWRESPFQFAHAYLYPLAPRTWRASLEAGF